MQSPVYSLADEGVTEEIKRQTFVKHCFAPHHHKVLMRGILDQYVRHCTVGLLPCTRSGAKMSSSSCRPTWDTVGSDILSPVKDRTSSFFGGGGIGNGDGGLRYRCRMGGSRHLYPSGRMTDGVSVWTLRCPSSVYYEVIK